MEGFKNAKTVCNRRLTESELDQKELAFELEEAKSRLAAELIGISLQQYLIMIGESADEDAKMDTDTLAAQAVIGSYINGDAEPEVKKTIERARLIDPSFNAYIIDVTINRYVEGELGEEGKNRFEIEMEDNPELQLMVEECREGKEIEKDLFIESMMLRIRQRKEKILFS
jgi:hypothetical protein